jgi:endonuclease YncB( thermonuclease family)
MMGERGGSVLESAAALLLALVVLGPDARACGADSLREGRVAAIEDARTLRLADGRKIRLAAIEWGISSEEARAALSGLLLDRTVSLKGTRTPDRYGRIHAFASVNGSETPIQYALLDRGLAVTGTRIGDPACRKALLARERAARTTGLGIWGSGDYRLHQADDPAAILENVGRFAIVEGRVLSVRESGNTVYVNFGRRWSEDFTVTIAKRAEPTFIAAGLSPRALQGRIIRVRGVIEERAGPWIEATAADQFDWDGQQ